MLPLSKAIRVLTELNFSISRVVKDILLGVNAEGIAITYQSGSPPFNSRVSLHRAKHLQTERSASVETGQMLLKRKITFRKRILYRIHGRCLGQTNRKSWTVKEVPF